MGKRTEELNKLMDMYLKDAKAVTMFDEERFIKSLECSLLTDIARSLALIADKLMEDKDGDNK